MTENNIDPKTVQGFGEEWSRFDQSELSRRELRELYGRFFRVFPWDKIANTAIGFDLGCGTGRWAECVAPRVGKLHCIDPSRKALDVARKNLSHHLNCEFHSAAIDNIPLKEGSMDFGYCIGVLHHVPDMAAGIRSCVSKLKNGAPLLVYIYYAFDNRPIWYRWLWRLSDMGRRTICRCPFRLRSLIAEMIALSVYLPLASLAACFERLGFEVRNFPLSYYRGLSYYSMRTDALDRFGTRLERRLTAQEIRRMFEDAGCENVTFSDSAPFWCAVGFKKG